MNTCENDIVKLITNNGINCNFLFNIPKTAENYLDFVYLFSRSFHRIYFISLYQENNFYFLIVLDYCRMEIRFSYTRIFASDNHFSG